MFGWSEFIFLNFYLVNVNGILKKILFLFNICNIVICFKFVFKFFNIDNYFMKNKLVNYLYIIIYYVDCLYYF